MGFFCYSTPTCYRHLFANIPPYYTNSFSHILSPNIVHLKLNTMHSSTFFQVAEISLSYHPSPVPKKFRIANATDAVLFFREHWDKDTLSLYECSKLILTNRAGIVMGIVHLSQGGITGTIVDVHLIMAIALKSLAKGIILCHNHPSGNRRPSPEDKKLHERLTQACALFDIEFLDNLILTKDDFYSFTQEF